MSNIWLPEDNIWVTTAFMKIEVAKFDIQRNIISKQRLIYTRSAINLEIGKLKENLFFLKKKAKIVNMASVRTIVSNLRKLHDLKESNARDIKRIDKKIEELEAEIRRINRELPRLYTRILEFKK